MVIRYFFVQEQPKVQKLLARVIASSALGLGLAFATSLWTLIESTAASFRKDARILDLAVELFELELERLARGN